MVSRRRLMLPIAGLPMVMLLLPVRVAPGQPASVDACALYTREEVAALAKAETRKPRDSEHKFGTVTSNSCSTRATNSAWTVDVNVERGRTKQEVKQMMETLKSVAAKANGSALKAVQGLGDEAYWGQSDPNHGTMHIVVGTSLLTIATWGKAPDAGTLDPTKGIATLVVKRFKERYPG